ncbi:MAG TPA: antitoxin MazE-like protein [Rhodanobacteraceae bacterium]|nr:antitoxin MazE-like protein [Rhodanobacteraceae bacterium]
MHRKKSTEWGNCSAERRMQDIHAPSFVYECRRQSRLANEAESVDPDLARFMDAALDDLLHLCDSEECYSVSIGRGKPPCLIHSPRE